MFHSPSVRLYTTENAESMVQRKPGSLLARKPFLDRSVNSKTPDTGKLQKSKLNFSKATSTVEKRKVSPKLESLNGEEFMYSFKNVKESYEDILPKSQTFGKANFIKILRNYCNIEETPPPLPEPLPIEINPMFVELPSIEMPVFQFNEEPFNKSFNVDLPHMEDNDLDICF